MDTLLLFTFAAPQMWLQIVLFVVGIIVVTWGADRLTDGAVGLAERMGIPQIVIGLTIVAVGTSMPEFFVSLMSAVNATPDLAVGNVVGSNIFNALFIVGVAAALTPIDILHSTVKKDIPFALVSSVVLLMMCLDAGISRLDAAILSAMFVLFMYITLNGVKDNKKVVAEPEKSDKKPMSVGRAVMLLTIGLVCLVLGSNVFVDNASAIAKSLGMSEALIGLTIVSCGTSLPELATSVVAARRGNSGIAIGNVLGSNAFNILMTLGITGLITPMRLSGITTIDLSIMVISMVLLWLFSFTKHRIERWEGGLLVAVFVGYMSYLVSQAI
jgi:cation:H+ antiporter